MNKLAKILKLIESFYQQSLYSLAAVKEYEPGDDDIKTYMSHDDEGAQGDVLQQAEDLWDTLESPSLAHQFELLMESYKAFLNSLYVQPDPGKSPEEAAQDAMDETLALKNTLVSRWEKILQNPTLQQEPDEIDNPGRIVAIAEALVKDANDRLADKASQTGVTAEELEYAHNMSNAQVPMQGAMLSEKENQARGDALARIMAAQKKFREKMKDIKKFGPENLAQQREELANQIEATTNQIEKDELVKRLKNMPDPEQYRKFKARIERTYQKMKADPVRWQKHLANQKEHVANYRQLTKKREDLFERIRDSASSAERNALLKELVRIEEQALRNKKINLDDPEVAHNPNIIKMLNPEEIFKKIQKRYTQRRQDWEEQGKRKRERKGGRWEHWRRDFTGALQKITEHLPNIKMGDKKKLQEREVARLLSQASAAEKTTYKPYLDKIAAARAAGDSKVKDKAEGELKKALNKIIEEFEEIKTLLRNYEIFVAWRAQLEAVEKSVLMERDELSEAEISNLQSLVEEGKSLLDSPVIRPSTKKIVAVMVKVLYDHVHQATTTEKMRIAPEESAEPEADEEGIGLEQQLQRRTLGGFMSKKQRKEALKKVIKEAFVDTTLTEQPVVTNTQDPQEYAHQLFQKLLAEVSAKLKSSIED